MRIGSAAGRIDNLMVELGLNYQTVQGGLNAEHQGSYLFAGGQSDIAPATAATMADLTAAPSTAATFANDTLKQKSRIDEKTTVETGFLASEIGGPLTDADGRMIGSMMVLDLPDETAVHAWLAEDPYVRQDVWKDISILPFQIAPLKYRPLPGG